MNRPIYLDHQATTPIDPAVLEAMMPYLTDKFGNAASRTHRYGWEAEEAVHTAREQIAALIGAKPEEIVLTSGATESDNLALKGIAWAYRDKGNHIITTTTEHKAVLDSCKALEKDGFHVTYVPVDRMGLVDPDDIRRAITPHTVLISVMYVNSEIGTIGPLAAIGAMAHEHGVWFHSDAVQGAGKSPAMSTTCTWISCRSLAISSTARRVGRCISAKRVPGAFIYGHCSMAVGTSAGSVLARSTSRALWALAKPVSWRSICGPKRAYACAVCASVSTRDYGSASMTSISTATQNSASLAT